MKFIYLKKNLITTSVFIFGFVFSSFSQSIDLNDKEINQLLCKTWQIDYGILAGERITGMEEALNDKYIFNSDHTYDLKSKTSENVSGEWKYDHDKKLIKLSMNGTPFGQITNLNSTKLIITSKGMPGAEFYLNPVE